MRKIKTILIILLIAAAAAYAASWLHGLMNRNEPPVISLSSDTVEVSVKDDQAAMLKYVSAYDSEDGDLTDQVIVAGVSTLISSDTAKVTYMVFDSKNSAASCTGYVKYTDYRQPRFILDQPLVFPLGQKISIADRLFATDLIDGDITSGIRVSTVNLSSGTEGRQSITVYIMNSMGDMTSLELPVVICGMNEQTGPTLNMRTGLVYIEAGEAFNAQAYCGGAVLSNGGPAGFGDMSISGEVDTQTPGVYYVTYTVKDGNMSSTAVLTVVVV